MNWSLITWNRHRHFSSQLKAETNATGKVQSSGGNDGSIVFCVCRSVGLLPDFRMNIAAHLPIAGADPGGFELIRFAV